MPSSARRCRSSAKSCAKPSNLRAGETVLDVAAGNGNASLAAARRWCEVTSTDYVPTLLERGRARAAAEGLDIEFRQADAEALPFADNAFDAVVSTFGVMFTPNQDAAAAELLRVCKPGGRIGLANWTPDGFVGQMFKIARQVRAAARRRQISGASGERRGVSHETVRRRLPRRFRSSRATSTSAIARRSISSMSSRPITARCSRRSPSLDAEQQNALKDDLHALVARMNKADDGTMVVPSEYLEVVITKR